MNTRPAIEQSKKLTVTFRVEPGCLGPQGEEIVDEFCVAAQKLIEVNNADIIIWCIVPRLDKTQLEMEFKLNNKKLPRDKAEKYLNLFDLKIDEFEECLHDKLALFIDEYLGH